MRARFCKIYYFGIESIANKLLIVTIIAGFIGLIGIPVCLNWRASILSYGTLNSAKMRVISEMEKEMPLNLYDTEWKVMSEKIGQRKYKSFTIIESRIPLFFTIIYFLIMAFSITMAVLLIIHVI